jgi:hypothetical protein
VPCGSNGRCIIGDCRELDERGAHASAAGATLFMAMKRVAERAQIITFAGEPIDISF